MHLGGDLLADALQWLGLCLQLSGRLGRREQLVLGAAGDHRDAPEQPEVAGLHRHPGDVLGDHVEAAPGGHLPVPSSSGTAVHTDRSSSAIATGQAIAPGRSSSVMPLGNRL